MPCNCGGRDPNCPECMPGYNPNPWDSIESLKEKDATITALRAQLEDADAQISKQDALLKEWASGKRVTALRAALRMTRGALVRGYRTDCNGRNCGECSHCAITAANVLLDKE